LSEDKAIYELKRIADAFEEQNRYTLKWIELQKKWHEEAEVLHEEAEDLTEKRYQERLDLDRQVFLYQRECHDESERLNEQRFQAHEEREQMALIAYLDTLRSKEEEKQ
jgi:hypothetical protein